MTTTLRLAFAKVGIQQPNIQPQVSYRQPEPKRRAVITDRVRERFPDFATFSDDELLARSVELEFERTKIRANLAEDEGNGRLKDNRWRRNCEVAIAFINAENKLLTSEKVRRDFNLKEKKRTEEIERKQALTMLSENEENSKRERRKRHAELLEEQAKAKKERIAAATAVRSATYLFMDAVRVMYGDVEMDRIWRKAREMYPDAIALKPECITNE